MYLYILPLPPSINLFVPDILTKYVHAVDLKPLSHLPKHDCIQYTVLITFTMEHAENRRGAVTP
jgi:hypothetical protein